MDLFAPPSDLEIVQRKKARQLACPHEHKSWKIEGEPDPNAIISWHVHAVTEVNWFCHQCEATIPVPKEQWFNYLPITVQIHSSVRPRPYITYKNLSNNEHLFTAI